MKALKPLLLLSFVFSLTAEASTIVWEQSTKEGLEQSSLRLEGNTLTYATNSNFMQKTGNRAQLGLFQRTIDKNTEQEFLSLWRELSQNQKTVSSESRNLHGIRIRVPGHAEAEEKTATYKRALALLEKMSTQSGWNAKDAVQIDWKGNKPEMRSLAGKAELRYNCKEGVSDWRCEIIPYGYVVWNKEKK